MKKSIGLFLILLMVFILLSCGDTAVDNNKDTENKSSAGIEDVQDNIPEEKQNEKWTRIDPELPNETFGGYTFNVLHWFVSGWQFDDCMDIVPDESSTGEVFNDAVYTRNKTIEEKYDIKINLTRMDVGEISGALKKMIAADENTYDLVYARLVDTKSLVTNGYFINLYDIPYLDFDMPWWDKRSLDGLSVGGKTYLASSDISVLDKDYIGCVLFNKKLAAEYELGNLYNTVQNGEWTLDYLMELCRDKTRDLNGNGTIDQDDFIPFIGGDMVTNIFFNGMGAKFAEKDENDLPILSFNTERTINVCLNILDFMYDTNIFLNNENIKADPKYGENSLFENQRALFIIGFLNSARRLRGMEIDFGVLPQPKLDKTQESYISGFNIHAMGLLSVPVTAPNLERTGIITEALSAESRYTVQPAYYDLSLKGKYVRDNESEDILDILIDTRSYDLGYVYDFGGFAGQWLRVANTGSKDIVSMYEKVEKTMLSDVEKFTNQLEKLEY